MKIGKVSMPSAVELELVNAIKEKIREKVSAFQNEWNNGIQEIIALRQAMDEANKKLILLEEERASLIKGIHGVGTPGVFDLDLKIDQVRRVIESHQKQINALVSRLTEVPALDLPLLNLLRFFKE